MRIAERWFELTRVDDSITLLTEPHVHPIWRSNVWHVRGRDADLLVDAGMGVGDLASALTPLLDKPLIAFATHRHSDHIGSLHQFETRLAHGADADEIATPSPATLRTSDFPPAFHQWLAANGHPATDLLIDALPHGSYDASSYVIPPAPPTRLVGEGDVVDLGDRSFEVLHLPGHTPGSVGLWEPTTGTLFAGDAVYDGPLFDFLPESSIPDYLVTMRRLRGVPVTVVHAGHEPSFGRERLRTIADDYIASRGVGARS